KPANLGKAKSIRAIAEAHGVPYGTLHRWLHGVIGIWESNQKKQKLSPVQEWSLVQFLLESAERGFPLKHPQIAEAVNTVLQAGGTDCEPVKRGA
ncbi:hypothetical protein DFH06DRAFT_989328, partial [Mycena polygramma]